jgi:hypothetical protein
MHATDMHAAEAAGPAAAATQTPPRKKRRRGLLNAMQGLLGTTERSQVLPPQQQPAQPPAAAPEQEALAAGGMAAGGPGRAADADLAPAGSEERAPAGPQVGGAVAPGRARAWQQQLAMIAMTGSADAVQQWQRQGPAPNPDPEVDALPSGGPRAGALAKLVNCPEGLGCAIGPCVCESM